MFVTMAINVLMQNKFYVMSRYVKIRLPTDTLCNSSSIYSTTDICMTPSTSVRSRFQLIAWFVL